MAATEVKPVIGDWIKDGKLIDAVRVHSPLIARTIEHLSTMTATELSCSNLRGKIIDRSTNEISTHTIVTNAAGTVTTITLYTRSLDQEDVLSVHVNKGMWFLFRETQVTGQDPVSSGERTILAKGKFTSAFPSVPSEPASQIENLLKDRLDVNAGAGEGECDNSEQTPAGPNSNRYHADVLTCWRDKPCWT